MTWRILQGDCRDTLATLDAGSVQTCVTSPPYFGLRDYGHDGQIGLEPTPDEFVTALVEVFREVRRVLRDDGTVWLNLGDSYAATSTYPSPRSMHSENGWKQAGPRPNVYAGPAAARGAETAKPKDLLGIPWMVAFALRADGWYLRSDVIWSKPNPMPESVTDRPTKAHEYLFLLSKQPRYYFDADGIREEATYLGGRGESVARKDGEMYGDKWKGHDGLSAINPDAGRNKRSVWTVATQPYPGAHFATFPPKLIEPCILAGCPERACLECGAPWEREVEIESRPNWQGNGDQKHDGTYYRENIGGGVGNDRRARTDHGFKPSCDHDAPPVPGVVLDPFAGAGTTGVVALRHGRSFIGCELNPEYVELARRRIVDDAPLLNQASEVAA